MGDILTVIRIRVPISIITLFIRVCSRSCRLNLQSSLFLVSTRYARLVSKRSRAVSERWRQGEVSNKLRSRGADVCQNGRPHGRDSCYPRAVRSEKLRGSCRRFGGGQKSCKEGGVVFMPVPFPFRLFQIFFFISFAIYKKGCTGVWLYKIKKNNWSSFYAFLGFKKIFIYDKIHWSYLDVQQKYLMIVITKLMFCYKLYLR